MPARTRSVKHGRARFQPMATTRIATSPTSPLSPFSWQEERYAISRYDEAARRAAAPSPMLACETPQPNADSRNIPAEMEQADEGTSHDRSAPAPVYRQS